MSPACRIVVCGRSVFLSAIEAGLAALPEIEVIRIDLHLPGALDCIETLEPDAVVVERHNPSSAGKLDSLRYPLIELGPDQDLLTILRDRPSLARRAKPLAPEHQKIITGGTRT